MSMYGRNTNNRFSGYYSDLAELTAQKPKGIDGEWVVITSLNKKYYWDISSLAWTNGGSIDSTEDTLQDISDELLVASGLETYPIQTVGTTPVELTFTGKTNVIKITSVQGNGGILYIGKSNVTSAGANRMCQMNPGDTIILKFNDASVPLYIVASIASQQFVKYSIIGDGISDSDIVKDSLRLRNSSGAIINPSTAENQASEISWLTSINTNTENTRYAVAKLLNKSDYLNSSDAQKYISVDFPQDNSKFGHDKVRLQVNERSQDTGVNYGGEIYQAEGDSINSGSGLVVVDIARQMFDFTERAIANIEYSMSSPSGTSDTGTLLIEVNGYNKSLDEYQVIGRILFNIDSNSKNNLISQKTFRIPVVMDWNATDSRFGFVTFKNINGTISDSRTFFSVLLTSYQFKDL